MQIGIVEGDFIMEPWAQNILLQTESTADPVIGSILYIANWPFLWLLCLIWSFFVDYEIKINRVEMHKFCMDRVDHSFSTFWNEGRDI